MGISMWCNDCQEWTASYTKSGHHTCGKEVDSAGIGDAPNELSYEGKVSDIQ